MNIKSVKQAVLMKIAKILVFGAAVLLIAKIINVFSVISTPSTAAFSFLVIVLLSAFFGDLAVAISTSIVATLCFDYFFLQPFGTFHIAAAADWISLVAFLIASVMISHLTASAAENAAYVKEQQKAMRQLKEFARWLLETANEKITLSGIAVEALRLFSLEYCSIHVYKEGQWDHYTGTAESSIAENVKDRLKLVQDHPTQLMDFADESLLGVQYMQINKGVTPLALLAVKSSTLPAEALGTMAYLIGIRLNMITKET